MDSPEFSMLSSLRGDFKSEDFIQPHYKESYRLAIDHLVKDGRDSYQEFLKGERIGSFLSEDELLFITANTKQLPPQIQTDEVNGSPDNQSSSGTYWPVHSDVVTPDLDLGWPEVMHEMLQTNIDLLYHPPRHNSPTIKEVIRKHIQDARQVIAIVMDLFTDVDIFKEVVDASIRGVPVYVLLDDFHLKNFLTMAENQEVKIQQLRNMRVRTVKGQDYRCRSGAKFHGAMVQKFLLVDCHTAIYGSYSFAWSFEKIHLSMVQVIKGHLVKSYDEEFRTLYAQSTVPAQLCPPEGLFQRNGSYGQHSGPHLERRNQLRHTLDTVYRKTCERKLATRDLEGTLFEDEPAKLNPLIDNRLGVQDQMSQILSPERMDFLKRHSYAGEGQDECLMQQSIRPRASNWNIRETGNGPNNYPLDNYLQPQIFRGQNMRQSYNGIDKQILNMQQSMPTLENTSKSFMRTLRIESYLKNPDIPFEDSCDYLDQFEPLDKAGAFMQGRMRSSLALRPTIPEQMDPYRHMKNSSMGVGSLAAPNVPAHYKSMQWNPTAAGDHRTNSDDFMLNRKCVDDNRNVTSYGPGRTFYQSGYASLGRAKGGQMIINPDILPDDWQKRHSVADPRSNTEYMHESSGHVYGILGRMNRSTAGINAQNGGYRSNLNGDQRSISHYDVQSITSTNSPNNHNWEEPPCRTMSAAVLDVNRQERKPNGTGSQHSSSSSKIKSLLNIREKKEDSVGNPETSSLSSACSTDTLTAEDEEKTSAASKKASASNLERRNQLRQMQDQKKLGTSSVQSQKSSLLSASKHDYLKGHSSNLARPPTERQGNQLEDDLKSSKPRFTTEDSQEPQPKPATQKKHSIFDKGFRTSPDRESWRKDRGAENRLYSRFEPFCSFEKKPPARTAHGFGSAHAQERSKSLPKGDAAAEGGLSRSGRGHHENKLEKFFHRVGNLINKNK